MTRFAWLTVGAVTQALLMASAAPAVAGEHPAPDQIGQRKNAAFRVVGYLPDYRMQALDRNAGRYLTDLIYFSVEPDATGELKRDRLRAADVAALQAIKQRHGVALYLCIGGWERSAGFAPLAASPAARKRFAAAATQFCLENRFDGIDLDWEHPAGDEEYRNFAVLLAEIKRRFAPRGLDLTIAVAGWQTPPAAVIAAVDRIHLMAYDAEGRHSTLEFAGAELDKFSKSGVPPAKTCLGLPFYGRGVHDRGKTLTYAEIARRYHPAAEVDEVDGVYFNGAGTIERKTKMALQRKLAGVMMWELGQDAADERSLLHVIDRTIRHGPPRGQE
ncbi:MAG TPA: glycoside hydrolase family 18 protein [Pirellulales bacterium]|nr:glycoside hydrolase family 18 protein [Pirellulales bacterium]